MTAGKASAEGPPVGPRVFLLSFEHRDSLARTVEQAGWLPVAARRADDLARRFAASGAAIALIDARGALEPALAALRELKGATPLLVLLDEAAAANDAVAAGAGAYLAMPFDEGEVGLALTLASRRGSEAAGASGERRRGGGLDPLTGLESAAAARRWLTARGQAGHTLTLILARVSRFDMVNAAFDRTTGDALLMNAARRIERLAREAHPHALVARLGGAEFAVALADMPVERGERLAREIEGAIGQAFATGAERVPLAARTGMASGRGDGLALLRRATAAIAGEGEERLDIDLRGAIDRGEIELLFQPQVAIADGAITGVEALARWRHGERGEIGAERLFAAAMRSDFTATLSRHIRTRAFAEAARWPTALSHLKLSINITAEDLAEPGFAERFLADLDGSGLARGRITAEVTESGFIAELERASTELEALRAGGCRVAIDDFGTGYSSLAWLAALPADALKLDARMTRDLGGGERARTVVRGVIAIAKALGLLVIAEGVETEAQRALLAAEGCDLWQGYLRAPPLTSEDLAALLIPSPLCGEGPFA